MDMEILYSLIGIIGFIVVIFFTLRAKPTEEDKAASVKTKVQKKAEIILEYKAKLKTALKDIKNDKELRIAQKTILIKEYNDELSRNIFFDSDEVREIILELSAS